MEQSSFIISLLIGLVVAVVLITIVLKNFFKKRNFVETPYPSYTAFDDSCCENSPSCFDEYDDVDDDEYEVNYDIISN